MVGRLPSLRLVRFVAALLLATIGMYACEPVRGLQQSNGSAFSSSTYQVAVTPYRRTEIANVVELPAPPLPIVAASVAIVVLPHLIALPLPRPNSNGPPKPAIFSRKSAPRAPPYA